VKTKEIPDLSSELIITTSRSSGPGGQHVNKVETKVEIKIDILRSKLLTQEQKEKILFVLGNKLIQGAVLSVTSQEKRSQIQNKENAARKLYTILEEVLQEEKERIPTLPTEESKAVRIQGKKRESEHKKFRGNLKGKIFE
jgi:ribosome-associated protein